MYLVLEYMKMGDLINVLKSRGADANTNTVNNSSAAGTGTTDSTNPEGGSFTPLTDMEVWNIFRQVVSGIRYLHYQNVVHGDIKPQVCHRCCSYPLFLYFSFTFFYYLDRTCCWVRMGW